MYVNPCQWSDGQDLRQVVQTAMQVLISPACAKFTIDVTLALTNDNEACDQLVVILLSAALVRSTDLLCKYSHTVFTLPPFRLRIGPDVDPLTNPEGVNRDVNADVRQISSTGAWW